MHNNILTTIFWILSGILFTIPANAQKNKFEFIEDDLTDFKFSLYPMIDTIDSEELISSTLPNHYLLSQKISQFFDNHEVDIKKYKISILEKYEQKVIDLQAYKEDTAFSMEEIRNIWSMDNEYFKELLKHPLWKLMTLNPIEQANLYLNVYCSRNFTPQEYGIRAYKIQIAGLKIKTEKIGKERWYIFLDFYSDLYKFEYNLSSEEMIPLIRYTRK